jgi:hypothetical protein
MKDLFIAYFMCALEEGKTGAEATRIATLVCRKYLEQNQ